MVFWLSQTWCPSGPSVVSQESWPQCPRSWPQGAGVPSATPVPTDFLVQKDSEYCACRTPCAMVRYGKELSMVKIPSKASARYLAKKFNKTEQYIA